MHTIGRLLFVLLGAALVATGCVTGGTEASGEHDIVIAVPEEPESLDPCNIGENATARVLAGNVVQTLTRRDVRQKKLEPLLATEWKRLDDTTWRFQIRKGVKFHDGKTMDAEAVAFSINRTFQSLGPANCSVASQIFGGAAVSAKAADTNVVEVTTDSPDPLLPLRMSYMTITSPGTDAREVTNSPVGTGPYKFVEWVRGSKIVLQRSNTYWGESPVVQRATYVFRNEPSIRASMVHTGEAQMALGMPPKYQEETGAASFPRSNTVILRMDAFAAPFNDVRVRRAVNHAINREGIIKTAWGGAGKSAPLPIRPWVDGFNPGVEIPEYDPELAARLIDQASQDGVATKTQVTLFGRIALFPNSGLVAEAVAQQLREVGLNIKVQMLETAAWVEKLKQRSADPPGILLEAHNNNLGDASLTVRSRFYPDRPRSQVPERFEKHVASLIESAAAETGDKRTDLYQQLFSYLRTEVVQDAYIAYLRGVVILGDGIEYEATPQSGSTVRLSDIDLNRG